MIRNSSPSYNRAPSLRLQQHLARNGFLGAPLLQGRRVEGIDLEVHLRSGDEVHLYCGLTCLLKGKLSSSGEVWVESHKTYADKRYAKNLFRPGRTKEINRGAYLRDVWAASEPGFAPALGIFLSRVKVGKRQLQEGAVHARWSRIGEPWTAFDKEAALEYPSDTARVRQLFAAFRKSVDKARAEIIALARSRSSSHHKRNRWKMPPAPKHRLKLDHLAVDSAGNLVLVEIKDAAGSSSEIYYAPFQLLQNVWEWHHALNSVRSSLQALLDARVKLRLTPRTVLPLAGRIRAAVAFGDDVRTAKVKSRYARVLKIANAYLPPGIPAIETWTLERDQPVLLQ